MRSRWLLGLVAVIFAITAALAFSGCTTILGTFDVAPAGTGAAEGTTCSAATQCASGFCSDGVCCEAACSGTCEACNLAGTVGKCTAIPDGQDPAVECPTTPLPVVDAGDIGDASLGGPLDAGDAGQADASASDAGGTDAGIMFALPAAGITASDSQCAGSCNGQRACKYPGTERTCGSTFCTTPLEQGRASCDTKGHCLVGSEACAAYACADGSPGCKSTCNAESDCQSGFYCNGPTSSCKPKLGDGSTCSAAPQCKDGYCVDGVCCNAACKDLPGGTCTKPGSVGQCSCTACATGACQLYYRDEDQDGHGDINGTVENMRAAPGCIGAPPMGFVDNHDDCLDGPKGTPYSDVYPGQTSFFSSAYSNPKTGITSFDYDCSGTEEKQTAEGVSGCAFCGGSLFNGGCKQETTSCTNGQQAGLGCGLGSGGCVPTPGRFCALVCTTSTPVGFYSPVNCGGTGTLTSCGTCSGNAISGTTYTYNQYQRCH